jgi:hypothetical protein
VAAKAARHPHAGTKLADLRHAVHRVAQGARPRIVDGDLAELWVGFLDVGSERFQVVSRIARPYGCAARPHQPVTADDVVMIVGKIGIADSAAILDRVGKTLAKRHGGDHVGGDGNERRRDARQQSLELHVSGQHDLAGAQPRSRRGDALAYAYGIDRQGRRVFENARPIALRRGSERQCVVERMDGERPRVVNGAKVTPAA